jgi:hypothetical protein
MKKTIKYIFLIVGILLMLFLHLIVLNLLPFPANQIHIIFIATMWLVFFVNKREVLWVILPLVVVAELWGDVPFGVNSSALLLATVLNRFLISNFFTNRSIFIIFISGIIGMAVYRIIYFLLVGLTTIQSAAPLLKVSGLLNLFFGILLTSFGLLIVYALTINYIKRFNPQYLGKKI